MISFANLSAFWGLLAIPLVALAYRLRKPAKKLMMSSLFLLEGLKPKQSKRRRIEVPLRYLFEAIALLLAVFALANPLAPDAADQIVVVLDNSLSMGARADGSTRFESAQERVSQFVAQQSAATTYIFATTTGSGEQQPTPLSRSELLDQVRSTAVHAFPDTLVPTVEKLRKLFVGKRIVVATDQKLQNPESQVTALSTFKPTRNAWITSVKEEPSELGTSARTILVGIAGTSDLAAQYQLELRSSNAARNSEALISKAVTLRPGTTSEERFRLPIARNEVAAFEVRLVGQGVDGIDADNAAYIVLGSAPDNSLVLVSDSLTDSAGLDSLRFVKAQRMSVSQFASMSPESIERVQLFIFHRIIPSRLPRKPALFILPPRDNLLFPVVAEVQDKQFSSWDSSHPIFVYVNAAAYSLPQALVFQALPWTQAVGRVEQGPVLLAGESGGVRLVAAGMELLPFERSKTPGPSILLLNTLKWLAGGEMLRENAVLGEAVNLTEGEELRGPDGQTLRVSSQGTPARLALPGVYTRSIPGKAQTSFAANVFFPNESETLKQQEFALAVSDTVTSEAKNQTFYWPHLVGIVVLFVLGDLLFAQFSSRRAIGAQDGSSRRTLSSLWTRRKVA